MIPDPFALRTVRFCSSVGWNRIHSPYLWGYGSRSFLAPEALVGNVVGDPAVVERHREGGEDAAALDGEAGTGAQGVADHAGVLQRQVRSVPDTAAAGEAVGPGGFGVVALDQVVPQHQASPRLVARRVVRDADAGDARRAMGAAGLEAIAA